MHPPTALTYPCVVANEQQLGNDHRTDNLMATGADKSSEPLPQGTGHAQAKNFDLLESGQQSISRHGQLMAANNDSSPQEYSQTTAARSSSSHRTAQSPSNSTSEANYPREYQDPTENFGLEQSDHPPIKPHANVAEPTAFPATQSSSSEHDVNYVAPERRWKTKFLMVIHLENGNTKMRVTGLDTGADTNIISIDVVDSLGLRKERYQGPQIRSMGGTYTPQWEVTFDWHVAQRQKTYTSKFAVFDEERSDDFDLLLGRMAIEACKFYVVNDKVWFHTADEEAVLSEANSTA
ncbi:MAG: hypothetical protein Q9182_005531 [Xanthomendoza sp. 2 TL-2023]